MSVLTKIENALTSRKKPEAIIKELGVTGYRNTNLNELSRRIQQGKISPLNGQIDDIEKKWKAESSRELSQQQLTMFLPDYFVFRQYTGTAVGVLKPALNLTQYNEVLNPAGLNVSNNIFDLSEMWKQIVADNGVHAGHITAWEKELIDLNNKKETWKSIDYAINNIIVSRALSAAPATTSILTLPELRSLPTPAAAASVVDNLVVALTSLPPPPSAVISSLKAGTETKEAPTAAAGVVNNRLEWFLTPELKQEMKIEASRQPAVSASSVPNLITQLKASLAGINLLLLPQVLQALAPEANLRLVAAIDSDAWLSARRVMEEAKGGPSSDETTTQIINFLTRLRATTERERKLVENINKAFRKVYLLEARLRQ
jgi:hypothetical protein